MPIRKNKFHSPPTNAPYVGGGKPIGLSLAAADPAKANGAPASTPVDWLTISIFALALWALTSS